MNIPDDLQIIDLVIKGIKKIKMKNRGCVNLAIAGILLFLCCGGYFVLNEGYFPKLIDDPMINFSDVQPTSIAGREIKTAQTDESIIVMFDNNEPHQEQESYPFFIQEGSPLAMMSWIYGCNWMGIAGQVFYDGLPVEDIIVEIGGSLDGEEVMGLGITGLAADYGSHTGYTGPTYIKDVRSLVLSRREKLEIVYILCKFNVANARRHRAWRDDIDRTGKIP